MVASSPEHAADNVRDSLHCVERVSVPKGRRFGCGFARD